MENKLRGFTIVELLIVVVVIAILASITVVAYNGIQGRAYDTVVQSDLRNAAQKIEIYYAENGHYPRLLSEVTEVKLKFTKDAYAAPTSGGPSYIDLLKYSATPDGSPDGSRFAIAAISKSNNRFYISSVKGLQQWTTGAGWNGSDFLDTDPAGSLFTITGRSSNGSWQPWSNN